MPPHTGETADPRWRLRSRAVTAFALSALMIVAMVPAQAAPVLDDGPFTVAEENNHAPLSLDIAHHPGRNEYLAVYTNHQGGSVQNVFAVRMGANGRPIGSPIPLSDAPPQAGVTQHPRNSAHVAYNPSNNEYFVVWTESRGSNRPPGHPDEGRMGFLMAQRVSATGTKIGGNISLTGFVGDTFFCGYGASDVEHNPATGGYLVSAILIYGSTTAGASCGGLDPATSKIEIRSLSAAGAISSTTVVPSSNIGIPANNNRRPNLGHNPATGEFMVVWPRRAVGSEPNGTSARRLSSSGALLGSTINVSEPTHAGGSQGFAAGDPVTGNWLVVSTVSTGHLATRFSPTGSRLGTSDKFGSGTWTNGLVATGDGGWIAGDGGGRVTEFRANGQVAGQSLALASNNHSISLAVRSGSDPVRAAAVWGANNPRSVRGSMVILGPDWVDPDPNFRFSDVPSGHTFDTDIHWLAANGVTRGCNPPANTRFCPDDFVTRGQMAAFLGRALELPSAPSTFSDTGGNTFEADIAALAAAGVTRGCNPPANTRFCPDDFVTRGQMGAFLHRALGN